MNVVRHDHNVVYLKFALSRATTQNIDEEESISF